MFPEIAADFGRLDSAYGGGTGVAALGAEPLGEVFAFDFEEGVHTVVDGNVIDCGSYDAIAQWIELVLKTEPDTYGVYTEDEAERFGIHIKKYIGMRNYHQGFVVSELKREITEQLSANRFIRDVTDFNAARENRGIVISFTVLLADGGKIVKELIV